MMRFAGNVQSRHVLRRLGEPFRPHRGKSGVIRILYPDHAAAAHRPHKTQLVGDATQRDDSAVREGHGIAQTIEALLEPVHMPRQELLRIGKRRIGGNG